MGVIFSAQLHARAQNSSQEEMPNIVKEVISRLTGGQRGKVFLCNLEAAIAGGLIDPTAVRAAIDRIDPNDISLMDEDDCMGYLKPLLQDPGAGLVRQNDSTAYLPYFLKGDRLMTVLRDPDYYSYYCDSRLCISGHDFAGRKPGSSIRAFRKSAISSPITWVAPKWLLSVKSSSSSAEEVRDILGLVHYGKNTALVALHFRPPSTQRCFRPTAIEAIPNARFRQSDPSNAAERRWGATVDLQLLDCSPPGATITGAPELTLPSVALAGCSDVEFVQLGETATDRDTASSDRKFLAHLLNGSKIETIVSRVEKYLV